MTAPEPPEEAPSHLVQIWLCGLCLDGKGGECHTPGCALFLNRAPDISLRNSPMVTVLGAREPQPEPDGPPVCPRDHWKLGPGLEMDRVLTAEGGWECYGIRPDRSGGCGFRIGPAGELAEVTADRNRLKAAVQDAVHALKRLADPLPFGDQGEPLPPEAELRRDYTQAVLDELARALHDGPGGEG